MNGKPDRSDAADVSRRPIAICVHGAAGRMGQRLIDLIHHDGQATLAGAVDAADHPAIGRDAGEIAGIGPIGLAIADAIPEGCDVVIDFSLPEGALALVESCRRTRTPLVLATTGFDDDAKQAIAEAAASTPIVFAPNMSAAVNIAMMLVRAASRALVGFPGGVDAEVVERHHRFKKDAPSGTALRFGEIIAEELGQTEHTHGREGLTGERPQSQIGYHALRTGDNVGEHQIILGLMGETLSIDVRGHSRDGYALGAIAAAKWLHARPAGMYTMADVLGLDA